MPTAIAVRSSSKRYLKQIGADRRIKGSFFKENARRVVEAADEFVAMGVRSWPNS
jgi:hypothetical protein